MFLPHFQPGVGMAGGASGWKGDSVAVLCLLALGAAVGKSFCLFEPQHHCPFSRAVEPVSITNCVSVVTFKPPLEGQEPGAGLS